MTKFARQPNGERTIVLRPHDAELSLKRLEEWKKLDEMPTTGENLAEQHWISMLKEQTWTFRGFLDETAKRVLGHDEKDNEATLAGDLYVFEKRFHGWRRGAGETE